MNSSSTDDIDLEVVLIRTIRFIRSKFKGMVISAVLGSLILGALTFLQPRQYQSTMILRSDILTAPFTERLAEKIRLIIKENNNAELARLLNLSESEAAQVGTIEIETVEKKEETKEKNPSTFVITAEVTDNALLPKLEQGIMHMLEENDFVKIRVAQRRTFLSAMITKLDREINALDTLKRQLMTGGFSGAKSGALILDPSHIYTAQVELTRQQISYKNDLELANSIELIDHFTALNKPIKPHRGIAMMAGFTTGLLIFLIIITLQQLMKKSEQNAA